MNMLDKEECEKSLDGMIERSGTMNNCCCFIGECIKSSKCHFVLENTKDCIDYKCFSTIKQLIKERFEPHPYKFEDLKPNMWVWDDKEKEFIKCKLGNNRLGNDCVVYDWDISPDEEFEEYYREYEEGRFFPVTKALEYRGE